MNHSFNVAIATRYGVNAAILFERIAYWCQSNEANGRNMHEGRAWTFDSIRALCEIFPYLTAKAIRSALDRLEADGLILSGVFNEDKRDRTKWYALSDTGNCIFRNGTIDLPEKASSFAENGKALPIIDPVIDPVIDVKEDHQERAREESHEENPFGGELDIPAVDNDTARVCKAYQNQIGQIPGGKAWETLCSYIDDLGADAVIIGIEETNIAQPSNGWQYLKRMLDNFAERRVHDADTAMAAVNDHKSEMRNARASPKEPKLNYQQHSYSDKDFGTDFYFDPAKEYREDNTC